MLRTIFIYTLLLTLIYFATSYSQPSKIFWVDQSLNKIQSANLDGSGVTDVISGVLSGEGIAIDTSVTPMKLYYSNADQQHIVRMNFDGSNPEEVITGIVGLEEIDLDMVNRKIYWMTHIYSEDKVQRADLDSLNSNIETIYTSNYAMHSFNGLGLAPLNRWIFWSQSVYGSVDRINRINYDGTGRTSIGNYLSPRDIDVVGNKIYFIWGGRDYIMKADLDGQIVDTVLTNVNGHFFALDTMLGKVFWTEPNKIRCANLDGTGMVDLVTGLGYTLRSIALYYNPNASSITSENKFPTKFELCQNYPNPFNPSTTIEFSIPKTEFVTLKIYNLLGQEVATIVSEKLVQGNHKYIWDASGFASGVYYYTINSGSYVQSRKLILMQ